MEINTEALDFEKDIDKKPISKKLKIIFSILFSLLAFVIPFAILLIIFNAYGFAPFQENGKTIISLDLQSQYISYLRYFKYVLQGDNSLIYSQGKLIGGDFMSIYTYYLASPFNLLIVFANDESIPVFLLFINILKISFTSLNFYLMLSFMFKKARIGYLIFSISFGLISYSIIYMSNYMWLDGVMILPLISLGIHYLKENKVLWLYPLTLFYLLMSSWYIGFIVCLFVGTYFILIFFTMNEAYKERLPFVLRAVVFTIIGCLLSAAFWLTAFLHFSGTKATPSMSSFKFFSLSMLFEGFMENGYSSVNVIQENTGFITMFVGVIVLVFFFRFFMNKGYSKKFRIGALIFILFYCLVILNSFLSNLFHGGREPAWFPGRFSFVVGFIVCFLGALEFEKFNQSSKWSFIIPSVAIIVALPIAIFTKNSTQNVEHQYYNYSVVSICLYLITILITSIYPFIKDFKLIKKNSFIIETAISLVLIPLSCYSSYRGANNVIQTNINDNQYQSYETYLNDNSYQQIYDAVKNYDPNNNYRMESTINRNGSYNTINNNPLFYSYNGLSHYSSSEKKEVEEFASKLGFQYNGFFEKYDGGSTSSINSFLNVKYLIDSNSSDKNKPYFTKTNNTNNPWKKIDELTTEFDNKTFTYYQNDNSLSYAFIVDDMDREWVGDGYTVNNTTYWYDHFEFQNELFKYLTDKVTETSGETTKKADIFKQIEPTTISLSSNASYTQNENGYMTLNLPKDEYIQFTYLIPSEAYNSTLYFSEKSLDNRFNFYLNGSYYSNNTYWHKGIRSFNDNSSHTHTIKVKANEDMMNYSFKLSLVYEDMDISNSYLTILKKRSSLDLAPSSNLFSSSYKGTIKIDEETKDKTLLFTFPYENNVSIKIDGKNYKVLKRINIFSAVDFSSLSEGEHTIEFKYTDKGLAIGTSLSIIGLSLLVLSLIFYKKLEYIIFTKRNMNDDVIEKQNDSENNKD